ncbi:MAG TPA: substrate-binding domain-containing protein [Vicinamibacterales bacterium]|jgi:molybdate transport system substrate-binding protein|nr:substrate-binding domain-containing protein [Vicinamibacterales bacterium]
MKKLLSSAALAILVCGPQAARAEDVTLVAPGGMRCAIDLIKPAFEKKTGHVLKATIGSGGATHRQVVQGAPFDVPIVQPPLDDVIASGNVIESTEMPLAAVPIVVVIRKGQARPDISTADAVRKMLLAAKAISYPDGNNGLGGAAGVSFDATQRKLGIYDQMKPKVKRVQGVSLMKLLTKGDIDYAITFSSEVDDPGVEIVGMLPKDISTPTLLVAFISSHTTAPVAAKALLGYLASPDGAAAYSKCSMTPGLRPR